MKINKLTKHFSLNELIHSDTAILKGIDNTPSEDVLHNLETLAKNVLEPLRMEIDAPVMVTSGYRSTELNKVLHGAKTSHHVLGFAADIIVMDLNSSFTLMKNDFKFTQLILEEASDKKWIHVSYIPDNLKCEVLLMNEGKYTKIE